MHPSINNSISGWSCQQWFFLAGCRSADLKSSIIWLSRARRPVRTAATTNNRHSAAVWNNRSRFHLSVIHGFLIFSVSVSKWAGQRERTGKSEVMSLMLLKTGNNPTSDHFIVYLFQNIQTGFIHSFEWWMARLLPLRQVGSKPKTHHLQAKSCKRTDFHTFHQQKVTRVTRILSAVSCAAAHSLCLLTLCCGWCWCWFKTLWTAPICLKAVL